MNKENNNMTPNTADASLNDSIMQLKDEDIENTVSGGSRMTYASKNDEFIVSYLNKHQKY